MGDIQHSELQKTISHTPAVDKIVSHLTKIADDIGVKSFEILLEMNVNVGEHLSILKVGLDHVGINISDIAAKKVYEQFEQSESDEKLTATMAEIAELFNQNKTFNRMLNAFEEVCPGKSGRLRDFMAAEASCLILESCLQKKHNELFAKWQKLEKEYRTIAKTARADKKSISKKHKKLVAIREAQEAIKCRIEEGIKALRKARRIALTYKHQLNSHKKSISSLETIAIDPLDTTVSSRQLLAALLNAHPGEHFIDAVDPFTGKPKIYKVADPHNPDVVYRIKLTHPLVRYKRKKNEESRYAVCHSAPIGEGGYGVVYESMATIYIQSGDKNHHDSVVFKKKSADKTRVVKRLASSSSAKREADLMQKVMLLHAKGAVIDEEKDSAALVMRKFKGKEMIDHLIADWGTNGSDIGPNTFTIDQRIALTIMAGEAIINQVHASGVIHRDIKGDNIMVELDEHNNPLSAVVIDYGLSKHEGEVTTEGVGTVDPIDYRAPETKRDNNPTSDQKSDAYSYATLLQKYVWAGVMSGAKYNGLSMQHKLRLLNVIKKGEQPNPDNRATIGEIVNVFKSVQSERQHDRELEKSSGSTRDT